jgi:SanA protein
MPVQTIHDRRELAVRRRNLKRFLQGTIVATFGMIVACLVGNYWVKSSAQPFMYNRMEKLPAKQVALVLGTTKWIRTGVKNDYFVNRMEAAAMLFHNGKAKHLIVSGDSSKYHNEPREMTNALLALGVPSTAITIDYAGFRTYNSIARCIHKYGQNDFLIVSQASHNYRAVFLARALKAKVIAFNAKAPEGAEGQPDYREFWARLSAIMDTYIFRKPLPKGEKIQIGI